MLYRRDSRCSCSTYRGDDEYPSKLSFRLENSKWSQQYSVVPEDEDVIMRVYSDADRDDVVNLRIARGVGGTAGSVRVEIYCSFWMLNRTGLPLLYSSQPGAGGTNAHGPSMISDLVALATFRGSSDTSYHGWVAPTKLRSAKQITMFAPESANLRVRVANSKPSEYFDIEDHIGSLSGTLVIGSAEPGLLRSYDIGVSVDIGPGLLAKRTRIVSFVPKYFAQNMSSFALEFKSVDETSIRANSRRRSRRNSGSNHHRLRYAPMIISPGKKGPLWAGIGERRPLMFQFRGIIGSTTTIWSPPMSIDRLLKSRERMVFTLDKFSFAVSAAEGDLPSSMFLTVEESKGVRKETAWGGTEGKGDYKLVVRANAPGISIKVVEHALHSVNIPLKGDTDGFVDVAPKRNARDIAQLLVSKISFSSEADIAFEERSYIQSSSIVSLGRFQIIDLNPMARVQIVAQAPAAAVLSRRERRKGDTGTIDGDDHFVSLSFEHRHHPRNVVFGVCRCDLRTMKVSIDERFVYSIIKYAKRSMPAIRPRIDDILGISTAKSIDFILDHAHAYTDDGNCGDLAESRTMVNVDRFDISNLKIMFAFLRDPSMSVLELPVGILRKLNVRIGPTTLKLASLTLSHHLGSPENVWGTRVETLL